VSEGVLYDDGRVRLDGRGITARRYDALGRDRFVAYADVVRASRRDLTGAERWRLWGTGDLRIWFGIDARRRDKRALIIVEARGRRMRMGLTPDDPDAVVRILTERHVAPAEAPGAPQGS
jgi:hypothetical protein